MSTNPAEMILGIVNQGYEDKVIEVVSKVGATGGTFISAQGLAKPDAEKFFGISIHPEKQIVLIIVPSSLKADILNAFYEVVGLNEEARGIAISIPVDDMTDNLKKQLFGKKDKNKETK